MHTIILFDGVCHFCNQSVQFIIKRDPHAHFKFASLQSDIGQQLMNQYNIPLHIDSLIVLKNNKWYEKSAAALNICKQLSGLWKLAYLLLLIPRPIRDYFYTIISLNRYKWFGTTKDCPIRSKMNERFL